jgi:hypothetical protein
MSCPTVVIRHPEVPITEGCPVLCLRVLMRGGAYGALVRAYEAPFERPDTVRDVLRIVRSDQLSLIQGIGPKRSNEIKAALVLAGLSLVLNSH